ncbi:nitrous oxide reductase accessory protein NosL [Persephonella sp. KM09-Lau-8]|uniref:nitrous oxide reductase accessory protein NosL n=1 Tax=Persephonella sp. KM09-Lau-8 TaxID=1158345 RepID=UPI00068974A5|nr:nitrous oxide reductase accessory protein NosL [Persephonella sp. KM09-Lau-8]
MIKNKIIKIILLIMAPAAIFLFTEGCQKKEIKPVPINYGQDECAYCRMKVTDPRYGSELLLKTGKAYKFDSVECLAAFYLEYKDKEKIHSLWVPDFLTKKFIPAEKALYLRAKDLPSPMGMNLSAFENRQELEKVKQKYGGEILNWKQVLQLVKKEWIENKDKMHKHKHMNM